MPIVKGTKRKGGMADQPQADTSAVKDSPQEPMPSSEQNVPETQPAEASPQGDSQAQRVEEPTLPEGVPERTSEQFNKLKRQLAEEKEKRLSYERVMSKYTPPQVQAPPSQTPEWYNPETQEVQVSALDNKFRTLEQQLQSANRTIQGFVSQEDERQAKETYQDHPDLDPNGAKFNEEFHKAVVGYLATAYAEGKNPSMKQAADAIKSIGSSGIKKAEEAGAKKALESLTPKEQASLEATGRSDNRPVVSMDDLQDRSRKGDIGAIMERLKNISTVGT